MIPVLPFSGTANRLEHCKAREFLILAAKVRKKLN
jgi:hypothetical protein